MPRYKVRSEGDVVRMGDQILLESVKTPGQFIHVGSKLDKLPSDYPAELAVLLKFPEVDLSVLRDPFVVRPHIIDASKENKKWLRVRTESHAARFVWRFYLTISILSLFF